MNKRVFKKRYIVVFLLVLVTCTYFAVFSPFAWVGQNKNVGADNAPIIVENKEAKAVYDAFIWDYDENAGVHSYGDGTEITTSNLDMNPYDTIFMDRNDYTPAVIRIELTGAEFEGNSRSGKAVVRIERDLTLDDVFPTTTTNSTTLSKKFTSIVGFDGVVGSELYSADEDEQYQNVHAKMHDGGGNLKKTSAYKHFVEGDSTDGYTKKDVIEVEVPYTAADWNGDNLYVYLFLSYDATLTQEFLKEQMEGKEIISLNRLYPADNDLALMSVSYKGIGG